MVRCKSQGREALSYNPSTRLSGICVEITKLTSHQPLGCDTALPIIHKVHSADIEAEINLEMGKMNAVLEYDQVVADDEEALPEYSEVDPIAMVACKGETSVQGA